jgi:hypothetical protein
MSMDETHQSSQQRSFNMMRKQSTSNEKMPERRSITGSLQSLTSSSGDQHDKNTATMTMANRRHEGLYVKFLRLGGIQIEVSSQGFILNVTKFKAQMDEFRCQGEVLQWPTLIANMERHMAVSLFTNAASNSLSRFTHLFRFPGQHSPEPLGIGSPGAEPVEMPRKKSTFALWDNSEDLHTATSLKRSALGLPPTKGSASQSRMRSKSEAAAGPDKAESWSGK